MEVAGLVLGGFSLVISAMEHYGTMEKMSRTWWKLKREHRKDLGRLRDCELMYRANMRTLLAPLRLDGTIDAAQLELLLADLESKGWQEHDVNDVLSKRLGERKERYFDNLREMQEIITKLAKVSMAQDTRFQASLARDKKKPRDPAADAARNTMLRANDHLKFELKRVSYTLTMYKRESLLNDIERCNSTLKDFLSVQDGTQDEETLTVRSSPRYVLRRYGTLLAFWKHANCIHRLMRTAWRCACSSFHNVDIQLDQHTSSKVCLDMLVRFGDVQPIPQTPLWEKLSLSIAYSRTPQQALTALPNKVPSKVKFDLPNPGSQTPPSAKHAGSAIKQNVTSSPLAGTSGGSRDSLCQLAQKGQTLEPGVCICTLIDDATNDMYEMSRAEIWPDDDQTSTLANVLAHNCNHELLHMHRLALAYNIANTYLKFGATSWLHEAIISKAVHLPLTQDGSTLLHRQAFVKSGFNDTAPHQPSNNTFPLLGILLLELCFNKTLEQDPQWQTWQQIPDSVADPVLRLAVATKWARDVEDVWSLEGAQAINWCLHLAKAHHDGWREEFASNVVEPLRILCNNAGLNIDKQLK